MIPRLERSSSSLLASSIGDGAAIWRSPRCPDDKAVPGHRVGAVRSNKGLKQTSVDYVGASQLIRSVRRTVGVRGVVD